MRAPASRQDHTAPELVIRIKRSADGSAALSCTRADGTVTWQRQPGSLGTVFPPHDLTHYAVETTLGYRHGFFGLIADGWDISDFGTPWPRGPLPAEAREVEMVVGVLEMALRFGRDWTAAELRAEGERYASGIAGQGAVSLPPLRDDQIDRLRARRSELLGLWAAVPAAGTLELPFSRSAGSLAVD